MAETYPGLNDVTVPNTITSDAVKVLVMKCKKLTHLSASTINDDVLVSVGENCKDLKSLFVSYCLGHDSRIGFVVSHCKKFKWIGACAIGNNNNTFNRELLDALIATNPNIEWKTSFYD